MRKPLETLGALLILGGAAGIVHRFLGWAPFGIVARGTPYLRDHETVAYVALIVAGLAVLVVVDKVAESHEGEEPSEHDGS